MDYDNVSWRIRTGTPPCTPCSFGPADMLEYRKIQSGCEIRRIWRGHPEFGKDFEVEICLRPMENGLYASRFFCRHYQGKDPVLSIAYPRYEEPLKDDPHFLLGAYGIGVIINRENLTGTTPENPWLQYNMAAKLGAFLHPDGKSVYFDIRDPDVCHITATELFLENDDMCFQFTHTMPLEDKPVSMISLGYDCSIGEFVGSWFEAGQIYREWALLQSWYTVRKTESPLRKIGVWLWNRGRCEHVVPPALRLQKDLGQGVPVALDWYWWHSNPYDTDYPNYWPPRDGAEKFSDFVRICRENGIYVQTYVNGMCWDMDTWNWNEGGDQGVFILVNGTKKSTAFNCYNHHRLSSQCGCAAIFQQKLMEQLRYLHNSGLCGQYIDMIGNSMKPYCYSREHGHQPGGGTFFTEGYRNFIRRIRAEFGADYALSTEDPNETFMDLMDGMITVPVSCERSGIESVPLFTSIYHGRNMPALFGNNAFADGIPPWDEFWPSEDQWPHEDPWHKLYPYQFPVEYSRGIVWGIQPMVCNFTDRIYTDPEFKQIYQFILDGAKFHVDELEFLFDGRMLSPEGFSCPEHDVEFQMRFIFTKRESCRVRKRRLPKIFHSVWQAPDGRCALILANYTEQTVPWSYKKINGEMPPFSFQKILL